MDDSKLFKVTEHRNFSAHHMLIGSARAALKDAESGRPGWFYSELSAITLSALSIEALCNAIGNAVINDWRDFESMSPIAKLRYLCETLNVEFAKNKEPWATAKWLCKFRNDVAHAKPEKIVTDRTMSPAEYDKYQQERAAPQSMLEKNITRGNARRAVNGAEALMDALCPKVPAHLANGLYADSWSSGASLPTR